MATSTETPIIETANASSSSDVVPCSRPAGVDLLAQGRLPPIPTALLDGRDHDLLEPLRFLMPGQAPLGPPPEVERRELAAGLATANAGYSHPRAAELGELLAEPATRVIVTGQQPGLWGGPLLTLSKMAAAVRWAERLTAAGEPAIAVFWVATEDHDWAEAASATLLGDEPARVDLGDDEAPLQPLGLRSLGAGLEASTAAAVETLRGGAAVERFRAAVSAYAPEVGFGEAFCRFYVELLGARAPLFLDSMLPAVKAAQRRWLRRIVEDRGAIDKALAMAHATVEERGYPLQVTPQPGLSPLFVVEDGTRRRIEWDGGERYSLRGGDGARRPVDALLATIDENPGAVSPGVLARPAVQDAILGTTLQVLGPAELSYMTQASALYPVLGLAAPWTSLRPQVLLLEERQQAHLDELARMSLQPPAAEPYLPESPTSEADPSPRHTASMPAAQNRASSLDLQASTAPRDGVGDPCGPGTGVADLLEAPVDELLARRLAGDVVAPFKERLDELSEALREAVTAAEPTLDGPWRKTRDQMRRALDQLDSRVTAAVARRHDVWRRRLDKLRNHALPDGTLQERKLVTAWFVSRYGPGFALELVDGLDLDPRRLQVLTATPAPAGTGEAG